MAAIELKQQIKDAIESFSDGELRDRALNLFDTLGYNTIRQNQLDKKTYAEFKELYVKEIFNEDKALVKEWKYVDILFQLSKDEITGELGLFDTKKVDNVIIESYLFFTIALSGESYTRTQFGNISREMNRLFPMPVMILFKYNGQITLSIINRRINKKDGSRDVLEKVTLIKDVNISSPHRAHVEIFHDLAFTELQKDHKITNFVELQNAWQKTLDTKELNKRFYQELSNWYFWAMDFASFPDDVEKNKDIRNATNLIRLITRIIFIWFIKEKGFVPEEIFNKDKAGKLVKDFFKNDKSNNYYNAILQNLFFGTLNQNMKERKFAIESNDYVKDDHGVKNLYRYKDMFLIPEKDVLKLFADVPFLNGGLFDCLDKDETETEKQKHQYIDGFSRNEKKRTKLPDFLFFADENEYDLNEIFGTKNKKYKVRGLIEILSSYKFTITENTPIEEEIALDPELLGKVFENLLASYNPETSTTARKQTGSFYTPREIVNYMVDESLIAYFDQKMKDAGYDDSEEKIRDLISYSEETHQFDEKQTAVLICAIDNCKILDPACGSGAFPMGILHKLVHVLHKLDQDNKKWREHQEKKAIKETEEAYKIGIHEERKQRLLDIEDAFDNNSTDYGRKLYLIENCIYGVDIQPIAVQIAKLRFFISLIIDQKRDDKKENHGIRSLPNLETKFVAANTLIGLEKPEEGSQLGFKNPDIDKLETELKELRHRYFTAKTRKEKLNCQKEDRRLREKISKLLISDGWGAESAKQIVSFDPYDQNVSSQFFDPEWMFGLTDGFDLVIGNPPYLLIQNLLNEKNDLIKKYKQFNSAQYKIDLYHLFIEKGVELLKNNGILTYITPNTFIKNKHNNLLRELIVNSCNIQSFILFYSQVFENVAVDNAIFQINKTNKKFPTKIFEINNSIHDFNKPVRYFDQLKILAPDYAFNFEINEKKSSIINKINSVSNELKNYAHAYFGIQTFNREIYVSKKRINKSWLPVIDGANIQPYKLLDYTEFVHFIGEAIKSGGNTDVYKKERIVVRQIGKYPEGALCPPNIFTLNTIYNIYLVNDLVKIEFLLGILNSQVTKFYWLTVNSDNKETFPKIKKEPLESIPIPTTDNIIQNLISKIVNYVHIQKRNNIDLNFFESIINAIVYELFFIDEITNANANILKYLSNLPELVEDWSDDKKIKTIEKVYKELCEPTNPVFVAIQRQKSVEEVRIIEGLDRD